MEKKQRVPKGEYYWWLDDKLGEHIDIDGYLIVDDERYEVGNYFPEEANAAAMASKLSAALKGADVIEMPSESDIVTERDLRMTACDVYGEFEPAFQDGFYECYEYLKSKIVK